MDPATRYALQCNTATVMKILFVFLKVSDSIKELMQSCKSKSGDQVQTIVGSINALNVLCDETKNRLVTVSCKPTDIY